MARTACCKSGDLRSLGHLVEGETRRLLIDFLSPGHLVKEERKEKVKKKIDGEVGMVHASKPEIQSLELIGGRRDSCKLSCDLNVHTLPFLKNKYM